MTSAYDCGGGGGGGGGAPALCGAATAGLACVPRAATLRDGRACTVRAMAERDVGACAALFASAVCDDRAWPFDAALGDGGFRAYFCSHAAFVAEVGGGGAGEGGAVVVGCFYVKPNFPGRCDHVANGGFVVAVGERRRGVGRVMGEVFFEAARGLGYRGAMFNLVFRDNVASVRLWEALGMERVGVVPGAGRFRRDGGAGAARGGGDGAFEFVDAFVMYKSLVGDAAE